MGILVAWNAQNVVIFFAENEGPQGFMMLSMLPLLSRTPDAVCSRMKLSLRLRSDLSVLSAGIKLCDVVHVGIRDLTRDIWSTRERWGSDYGFICGLAVLWRELESGTQNGTEDERRGRVTHRAQSHSSRSRVRAE